MKKSTTIWLVVVVLVAGGIGLQAKKSHEEGQAVEVDLKRIERRDLHSVISASGKIRPKTMVDVSAAVSGKVLEISVHEGDQVVKGQRLFRIDPKPFETQVQQLEASIESAKANIELQRATLRQSESNLKRTIALAADDLVTQEHLERERTLVDVEVARLKATEQELPRLTASHAEARHELTKVDVLSDIAGTVTAVNIEAGEYAFVGAFNNPATVLMTVSDLDVIEAEVEVDETEAVEAEVGQYAEIEVDAHADWLFKGIVTEVGHAPVTRATGGEREGTAYLVKVQLQDRVPGVRPGMTCSTRIRSDERKSALALPIQALTMRKPQSERAFSGAENAEPSESASPSAGVARAVEPPPAPPAASGPADATARPDRLTGSDAKRRKDDEGKVYGVFYVKEGRAWFKPVAIGITGEKDFELLGGLEEGAEIVVGPFKALHELKEGDRIRKTPKKEGSGEAGASG